MKFKLKAQADVNTLLQVCQTYKRLAVYWGYVQETVHGLLSVVCICSRDVPRLNHILMFLKQSLFQFHLAIITQLRNQLKSKADPWEGFSACLNPQSWSLQNARDCSRIEVQARAPLWWHGRTPLSMHGLVGAQRWCFDCQGKAVTS